MITLELGRYRIEVHTRAERPWSHFRIHGPYRYGPWTKHLVWGRLSIYIDRPDVDEVQVCPHCLSDVAHVGDDGIDYCTEGCGCIEGEKSHYITVREQEKLH